MNDEHNINQTPHDESSISVIHPVHDPSNLMKPFVHALKLAVATRGELEIVDVRSEEEATEHVGVRAVLEKWGILPTGAHRSDVIDIGLRVKKVVREGNKKKEIIKRIRRHHHDILVIGTKSSPVIFTHSLAEYLADYFHQTTLFIPSNAHPFVDVDTGAVKLDQILIPVSEPDVQNTAFAALRRIMNVFPGIKPRIIGVHAGTVFPEIPADFTAGLEFIQELKNEPAVSAIVATAQERKPDLIIMATNGRDTISQKLIGSNTEQVVRHSPCPVLSSVINT